VGEAIDARQREIAAHRANGDCEGEAWAWNRLGRLLGEALRVEEAIAAHVQAVFLFETAGHWRGAGRAWNNLGTVLYRRGRVRGSLQAHTRARDIFQQVTGDRRDEGGAWTNLGAALGRLGRTQEEIEAYETALTLRQGSGSLLMTAHILRNLASRHQGTDDPDAARSYWSRAADTYADAGAPGEAACARALARVLAGAD
jgi:tetratricopeptide (TPR) repeat protein